MNKSILVIDTPKSCADCRLLKSGLDNYCPIGELTPADIWHKRDDNCPLRPLPKRMSPNECGNWHIIEDVWNACLDEILGEEV